MVNGRRSPRYTGEVKPDPAARRPFRAPGVSGTRNAGRSQKVAARVTKAIRGAIG